MLKSTTLKREEKITFSCEWGEGVRQGSGQLSGSLMPSAQTDSFFWDSPGQWPQNLGILGSNSGLVPLHPVPFPLRVKRE